MATMNNESDSDSFDMFTDSEGSDLEWHRASVDVYALPSDTTTTAPNPSKQLSYNNIPQYHNNIPPPPSDDKRLDMMKLIKKHSISMTDITTPPKVASPRTNTERVAMMKQMQQQSVSMANISDPSAKQKKKKKKRKKDTKKKKKEPHVPEYAAPHPPKTMRQKAINELIVTEVHYVSRLFKMIMFWAQKLEHKEKIISAFDWKIIFPPSLKTIATLNGELLKDLQQRNSICNNDNKLIISDILLGFAPYLKMYQLYINNSNTRLRTVTKCLDNAKFYSFHQKCRKHFDNLTLTDLIILPVQRIPRYKLLIQEIINNTGKKHPDYKGLQEALQMICDINIENNAKLKDLDARMKVLNVTNEIQKAPNLASAARSFVFSAELYKIKLNGKTEKHMFYLFNDCIVYAVPSKLGKKCVFKMRLPIDAAFAVQKIKDLSKYKNIFAIYSSLESFLVTTKGNGELKDKWVELLTKVINEARHGHYFHATSLKASVGRGSILISQAPLQIPKNIKKKLNKELTMMNIPQTLDDKKIKNRQRFETKEQIGLLVERDKMQVIPKSIIPEKNSRSVGDQGRMRSKKDIGFVGYPTGPETGPQSDMELSDDEKEFFEPKSGNTAWIEQLSIAQSVRVLPGTNDSKLKSKESTKRRRSSDVSLPKKVSTKDPPLTFDTKRRRSSWGGTASNEAITNDNDDDDTIPRFKHQISRSNPTPLSESKTDIVNMLQQRVPQNNAQRSAMMKQMHQQSRSVSGLVKSKKKPPAPRVKRRNKQKKTPPTPSKYDIKAKATQSMSVSSLLESKKKPPEQRDTKTPQNNKERNVMMKQMQTQSMSMQKINEPQNNQQRNVMMKQMQQQSMSVSSLSESKKKIRNKPPNRKLPQKKLPTLPNKKTTKPMDYDIKPKAKPIEGNIKSKGKGISNLVSRFNTEDTYSSNKKEPILVKKQTVIKKKNYDEYLTDNESKLIWNSYIDQHREEPPNEWALHKYIKAKPDLPNKAFRQARGIFRAFKGSGTV